MSALLEQEAVARGERVSRHCLLIDAVHIDAALDAAKSEAAAIGVELRAPMRVAPPTLIASLLLVEDFEAFAQMMQQRALEQE